MKCLRTVGSGTSADSPPRWTRLILGSMLSLSVTVAIASEPAASSSTGDTDRSEDAIGLFTAMAAGDVEVRLVPRNATRANLMVENKTDGPLHLRLPEAFAGVPVLAQFGGGLGGRGGGGRGGRGGGMGGGMGGGGGGGQQAFGGGGGMMGGGMMGGGMMGGGMGGGGFFSVPPEAIRKFKIATVCLEHGKKDPHPRTPYEIRPLSDVTEDAQVAEIVKMLGYGEIDQVSAQAATWHLTDGLSWQELAVKIKKKHHDGRVQMYFGGVHLKRAVGIVDEADRRSEPAESSYGYRVDYEDPGSGDNSRSVRFAIRAR